jgi:hypothetical protein
LYAIPAVAIILIHWMLFEGWMRPSGREFADPDGYTRMVRVQALAASGDWWDGTLHRSNAPHGESSHWTRPFDVVLLLGAAIASPILGSFDQALAWAGRWVSPLLNVPYVLLMGLAAGAYFGTHGVMRVMLFSLCQTAVLGAFVAGRPDHHSLILVCFAGVIASLAWMGREKWRKSVAWAGGVLAALGVWISVEGLAAVAMALAVLGILWIVRGGDRLLRASHFLTAFVAALLVMWMVERGPAWQVDETDRLSRPHVAVGAFVAIGWGALARFAKPGLSRIGRVVALGLATSLAILACMWMFPRFLGDPRSVDPRIVGIWLNRIDEMRGLTASNAQAIADFFGFLTAPAIALAVTLSRLCQTRGVAGDRWWVFLCGFGVYLPLSIWAVRWTVYAQTLALIPYIWLVNGIVARASRGVPEDQLPAARLGILIACFALPIAAGVAASSTATTSLDTPQPNQIREICEALREHYPAQQRILTFPDFGTEILYRTPHEIIATGNHRNGDGIFDAHRFFATADEKEAQRIARERGMTLILLSDTGLERSYYAAPMGSPTMHQRLARREPPRWLERAKLRVTFSRQWFLYEVIEKNFDNPIDSTNTVH